MSGPSWKTRHTFGLISFLAVASVALVWTGRMDDSTVGWIWLGLLGLWLGRQGLASLANGGRK